MPRLSEINIELQLIGSDSEREGCNVRPSRLVLRQTWDVGPTMVCPSPADLRSLLLKKWVCKNHSQLDVPLNSELERPRGRRQLHQQRHLLWVFLLFCGTFTGLLNNAAFILHTQNVDEISSDDMFGQGAFQIISLIVRT